MSRLRDDKNIRDYFAIPLLAQNLSNTEPESLSDIMEINNESNFSIFKFETSNNIGLTQNILDRYIPYLEDKPELFSRVVFDKYIANLCEFKSRSIAKYLYGDTSLFYMIMTFNDLQHDSELTAQYLRTSGLKMLNGKGFEELNKLLGFKQRIEAIDGDAAFFEEDY